MPAFYNAKKYGKNTVKLTARITLYE